jgi:cobyrinic acid a,c-diamide synthase
MSAEVSKALRIVWVYPDLLSTYGDYGNALILARRAQQRGIAGEVISAPSGQLVPTDGDIYLLGGGEDRPQVLAARRLRADCALRLAAEAGAVIFGVCAGYQLIGTRFAGEEGQEVTGLGLLDIRTANGRRRGPSGRSPRNSTRTSPKRSTTTDHSPALKTIRASPTAAPVYARSLERSPASETATAPTARITIASSAPTWTGPCWSGIRRSPTTC